VTNPYEQYIESSVLTATPLELVTMLYRFATDSVAQARRCLAEGDIAGRARPVTQAFDAITELVLSLDHENGGSISRNLIDLYAYMQQQLLLGHCNQCDDNFAEVERLLSTLTECWEQIARSAEPESIPLPVVNSTAPVTAGYGL
jgi:flagellar protein FliS